MRSGRVSPVDEWATWLADWDVVLLQSPLSPATTGTYLKHVLWVADSVACGPAELSVNDLARLLDSQNWSESTRRKVLVALRKFYAWAVAEKRCEWAPTAGLQSSAPRTRGPAKWELPASWREPVDGFVASMRAGSRSEGTVEQRVWRLRRLAEVAADPWAVTPQQLALWLSTPDWAPETKRASRSTVRMFYRWAVRAGLIDSSPAELLDPVKVPRSLPRPAPRDALRAALAAADDRVRLAVLLAGYAGLRRAEIARLHSSEIGRDQLMIVGKGGHHRIVPLHPDLAGELQAELERRRRGAHGSGWSDRFTTATGYLFPSDDHPGPITPAHMGKLVARVLPEGWTTHSLRHYFATAAYAQQRDLLAVQQLLGHARPETTARYAAVPDGALRTAVLGVGV
jgi:site-specific recombinase XerD